MGDLALRGAIGAADPARLQQAADEERDLEIAAPRPDEEIAGAAREHDRLVRGVDALLAEIGGGLAQALPGVPQLVGQVACQRRFGGRPAIVLDTFVDPLLAVITLVRAHVGNSNRRRAALPMAELKLRPRTLRS